MARKLIVVFAIMALGLAVAGTVPRTATYGVTVQPASVLNGTQLKGGDYRLTLEGSTVTLIQKNQKFVVEAKVENGNKKFGTTVVRYRSEGGKSVIDEVRLGGTAIIIRMP